MTDPQVARRKLFMHSAHKTVGVSAGPAAWRARESTAPAMAGDARRPPSVCLVSGSPAYRSDQSLAAFEGHLREHGNVECSRAFRQSNDDLPGLENLDQSDCMLLFVRRMTIDGEQLERIKRYCRRGGPIVGVRTASHGLQNWPEMDKEVFGGDYQGHFDNESIEVGIVAAAEDHCVLAGVEPFVSRGSLYRNPNIARDATVLLTGTFSGHTHPVAWTRLHHGGRVFYTSLGHPDDFRQPNFLRLLLNAVLWTSTARP